MLGNLLQVALGGAIGASARYLAGGVAARFLGRDFPWGTLMVNVVGSVLIGVLVVIVAHRPGAQLAAPFMITGLLGGFTTFSAFSMDALALYERGQAGMATVYVGGTLFLTLGGVAVGDLLARMAMT